MTGACRPKPDSQGFAPKQPFRRGADQVLGLCDAAMKCLCSSTGQRVQWGAHSVTASPKADSTSFPSYFKGAGQHGVEAQLSGCIPDCSGKARYRCMVDFDKQPS